MNMRLDNGVLASYQQCHFTPDYWRNYTVIGTEGRLENFGDDAEAVIKAVEPRSDTATATRRTRSFPSRPRRAATAAPTRC